MHHLALIPTNFCCCLCVALLHASHLYHESQHSFSKWGVKIDGSVTMDVPQMQKHKEKSVTGLTRGIEALFKKNKVTYAKGFGKVTGPNEVTVINAEGKEEKVCVSLFWIDSDSND